MPVDKYGRMSDAKTKDTGVSLTYINNITFEAMAVHPFPVL